MRIGELAKKTGLSIDAIRFYEKSGLIKGPERSEGGYREFNKDAVAAIEFISHCRSLDIPIAEIKKLLNVRSGSAKSCREANEVVDAQLIVLRDRIKELKQLEKTLSDIRSVCNSELAPEKCEIIRSIQKMQK
jgi:DNA-binding transcriptional MerR regulator